MHAVLLSLLLLGGCKSSAAPPPDPCAVQQPSLGDAVEAPGPPRFWNKAGLVISPARILAEVGTEVPMFAGVCDAQGHLQPYEKVEWMLDPSSAGSFVSVNDPIRPFYIDLVSSKPHKIDNNYAVGETLPKNVILTRGTPNITDDTVMPRGYTWVTVTSPREGVSYITAYAPDVYSWDARQKSAVIHWIDADWVFPAPVCAEPNGHATLTTCVTRHTTKAPVADWIVKYSISGGAPAGFAPNNQQTIEMATNDEGQSTVEIIPTSAARGTTCVTMELIRAECAAPNATQRLSIATAATQVTWTNTQATLRVVGPSEATVGSTANYRVEVANPGPLPISDITISFQVPTGLAYVKAEPAPESATGPFVWKLGQIAVGETKIVSLDMRVEQAGPLNLCATLAGPDGLTAQNCATTNVGTGAPVVPPTSAPALQPAQPPAQPAQPPAQPPAQTTPPPAQSTGSPKVELHFTGPQTAVVGGDVHFELEVANKGTGPANDLVITDRFDPGLEHGSNASPIQNSLGSVPAGQSKKVGITFHVSRAGKLCHTMEVSNQTGVHESAQACVTVAEQPALKVDITSNQRFTRVGDTADFTVVVTNTGSVTAQQVRATVTFEQGLKALKASQGVQTTADGGLVWTVDTLAAGAQQTWSVQCSCVAAAQRACGRVTLTDQTGLNFGEEACLQIVPAQAAPGGQNDLRLQVTGRNNPVKVNSEASYSVVLSNGGTNSQRQVKLSVAIPDGMQFVTAQGPANSSVSGQTVNFEPILEMRPGESINFDLRFRALRAGSAQVTAQVTSSTTTQPLTGSAATNIFAE